MQLSGHFDSLMRQNSSGSTPSVSISKIKGRGIAKSCR
uniref:Uncharacterized protein n=1 Tax=Fusarium oxysporum (strain Fo5176) TaxID=660025 RepID=A0A0D2Y066_FUSOF